MSATNVTGPGYLYPAPDAEEFASLTLLNRDRARFGVGPLKMSYRLCSYADAHSAAMVAAEGIFHSSGDQLATYGGPAWNLVGENVGEGDSVGHLNDAFMASYHHRINITNRKFINVGIGIKRDKGGLLFATHIFWG